ncbi:MAG: SpoIIE family protein phosphatase [Roseiflexaceae bacterium]|nr:SpoIIE family protein phosphatase [Roseiflexaceae bacterium]
MMNEIEVPADWASVEQLTAFADTLEQEHTLSEDQAYLLRMVIEEIATNIIKYGYTQGPGVIRLACGMNDGTLVIAIHDHGRPFDPRTIPDPDLESAIDERQVGGLGIFFVREFADSIEYQHDPISGWNQLMVMKEYRERSLPERLRNVSFFMRLSEADLEQIAEHIVERRLSTGEVLMREGDPGKSCFVILSGTLEALTYLGGKELVLEVRQAGQIMGEMALIDRGLRSATVRAATDSVLAELDEQSFFALMHADPQVALELLRGGTASLRRTSRDMISGLEAKNAELSRAYRDLQAAQADLIRLGRIEEELSVARRIQQLFLPRELPAPPGWEVAAFSRGALAVGGDFFDYIAMPGGRIGFVVADVAGKGVPAALFVALARSLLRATSQSLVRNRSDQDLAFDSVMLEAIGVTNSYMVREHGDNTMFITLFYGILEPQTGRLHYANVGHNPPLLVARDGSVRELELGCLPLGVIEDQNVRIVETFIQPGETLVGFSDGITEAMNAQSEMFGEDRLIETLSANATIDADSLVEAVIRRVDAFVAGAPQSDDITLLTFHHLLNDKPKE